MDPNEYPCEGGPLNGLPLIRRETSGSRGVLLVDRPAGTCWLYDWAEDRQVFVARQQEPMTVREAGPDNRYRAAAESEFDVVAAPWVVSDDDAGQ